MSKIIDDIVKTCNEIDARRNKEFTIDISGEVKPTVEKIKEYSGHPEEDAADDGIKEE